MLTTHVQILFEINESTYLLRPIHTRTLSIPPPPKLGPKRRQLARLVLLNIQQLLATRVPQRRVANVLCGSVDGLRVRRAQCEGRAVGERDQLREGVRPLGAPQKRCVPDLRGVLGGGGPDCGAEGAQGAE